MCFSYATSANEESRRNTPQLFANMSYQEANTIELLNIDKVTLLNQHSIELVGIPELIS